MGHYTYDDLGLPSIGEFTLGNMRHHRHPAIRALAGFRPNGGLRARATAPYLYTPGDIPLFPWEVAYVPPRRQAVAAWTRRRYGERQGQQLTPHMLQQHHTFNTLMAARPAPGRRYALRNNEFTVRDLNGGTERRILATAAEMREVLAGPLGLTLPQTAEVDAVLARLTTPAA